jgi:hypothetical protein
MWNGSTSSDYCQGISTKVLPFELRRQKSRDWKQLAGIMQFGETGEDGGWELEVAGSRENAGGEPRAKSKPVPAEPASAAPGVIEGRPSVGL